MLINNPLMGYLFDYGYKGIENVYEYWIRNKDDIIKSYLKNKDYRSAQDTIIDFEEKIRWASCFGLFTRVELERLIRISAGKDLVLENLRVRYDGRRQCLADFNRFSGQLASVDGLTNLRGVSILSKAFTNMTICNVDFSYGSFDSSEFSSVKFKNCRFTEASFNHSTLINCDFDKDCIFESNDFRCAIIDSQFKCYVNNPNIEYIDHVSGRRLRNDIKNRYQEYTVILDYTFADKASSGQVKEYMRKLLKKM